MNCPAAHAIHAVDVMGNHDQRGAVAPDPGQDIHDGRSAGWVEACEGFVEDEHLGLSDEQTGEHHSAHLPAAELVDAAAGNATIKSDSVERPRNLCRPDFGPTGGLDVFGHGVRRCSCSRECWKVKTNRTHLRVNRFAVEQCRARRGYR